ncbi:MAG: D-alanyl-D-alanine carboxypeptidase/D-alanyl-D-alanine-endopeptidase [Planctomycetes bacterium]|nr:D-alanyl-D-alanine carboxypeptidase/D-alanyl-D-alanine-endopeptidase [Planctomycetota bacterium]
MKYKLLFYCVVAIMPTIWGSVRADTISQILSRSAQKSAEFAILAVRAEDGKVLYSRNADKPMIPASNMKLVSTAAALHYLGPDYVFRTHIALLGDSLVVIGGGDPLLGDTITDQRYGREPGWVCQEIVGVLKARGIERIEDIVIDSYFFDSNRVHPSWPADQLNQWYACEVSGLNYNLNCVRITATRQNGRAVLKMEPDNDYLTLINQLRFVSSGNSAIGGYRTTTPNRLSIRGNLNQSAGFDVAIEHPEGLFANLLVRSLRSAGITVRGNLVKKYIRREDQLTVLHTFSTSIWDVLDRCNKDSLGLAAECLVKTISAENTQGRINGEWPHGRMLVGRYLNLLGVDSEQFVLDDGSGLSRKNRLSCNVLVAVLDDLMQKPYAERYIATLAEGGNDGTIARYFQQAPYRGNIYGKTGYIAGVRTFSGVCRTAEGDVVFSILTQGGNATTRQAINDITKAIFDGTF